MVNAHQPRSRGNGKRFLAAWLPVFAWMCLIFAASTDLGATHRSSRIIGPLLRWFNPDISEETISAIQTVIRKGGHLSEYTVLALLTWRARKKQTRFTGWQWREVWIVLGICALYASTDEFHQSFVKTRFASPVDVMIDTSGAFLGLMALWGAGKLGKQW